MRTRNKQLFVDRKRERGGGEEKRGEE